MSHTDRVRSPSSSRNRLRPRRADHTQMKRSPSGHRDPEHPRARGRRPHRHSRQTSCTSKRACAPLASVRACPPAVNVNLGISGDKADAAEEWKKVKIAEDFGADAIMDLSNSGQDAPVPPAAHRRDAAHGRHRPHVRRHRLHGKPLVKLTKDDLFEVVRAHAEDGVDFVTIHCGINKSVTKTFKETGRLMNIVSRGGSLLFGWMEVTGNENPFYEFYDELLEICHEYDVDDFARRLLPPGLPLYDSNDATETAEMIELGKLCKRAWAAGVRGHGRGPGSHGARRDRRQHETAEAPVPQCPVLCAGPLVTDIGVGYDHITAAIGGAIPASSGADFLCYVTPAEHLCLPNAQDVLDGLMATKIAAHAADIAKKVPHARDMDDKMGRHAASSTGTPCGSARSTRLRARSAPGVPCRHRGHLHQCGKMCAVRTVNKSLRGHDDRPRHGGPALSPQSPFDIESAPVNC